LGGTSDIKGSLYASFIVAFIEQLSYLILGGSWGIATPYMIMILILIVKPRGLFGLKEELR
jgi:branched-subunit amino acid ABC-type transport system permease component